ncbi:hypothetical protein P12x_006133 (plasmid) [Tundrisphaera lichenicola]|uniref:hypothetical protein n=1 Tax=Tundrisphaera lichenicola TaxID=2029860 RepID=UPI003EBED234
MSHSNDLAASILEVEIEDACAARGLDDRATAFIVRSHRSNPEMTATLMSRGVDAAGIVSCKLAIIAGLADHRS